MNKLKWHAGQFVGTWFGLVKGLVFVDQGTGNTVSLPIREALKVAWAELENYRYEALRLKGLLEKRNSDASKLTGELEQVRKELKRYQDLEKITRMHVDLPDGVEVSEIAKRFNDPRHRPFASGGLVGSPSSRPVDVPAQSFYPFSDQLATLVMVNSLTEKGFTVTEGVKVEVSDEPTPKGSLDVVLLHPGGEPEPVKVPVNLDFPIRCESVEVRTEHYSSHAASSPSYSCSDSGSSSSSSSDSSSSSSNDY